eukprot:gene10079-10609_t
MVLVESAVCVDLKRVYGAGMSNGGMFQYTIAADPRTAARFTAHAAVVASP